jgi:hypothetical protein
MEYSVDYCIVANIRLEIATARNGAGLLNIYSKNLMAFSKKVLRKVLADKTIDAGYEGALTTHVLTAHR